MGMYSNTTAQRFAQQMWLMWSYWDTMPNYFGLVPNVLFGLTPTVLQIQRERFLRQALPKVVTFMPCPAVVFSNQLGPNEYGKFVPHRWEIHINKTRMPHFGYGDFIEFATTIYHEIRHGEQFFRMAQGVASNQVEYPGLTQDQWLRRTQANAGNALSAVQRGQQIFGPAQAPRILNQQQLRKLLHIPVTTAAAAMVQALPRFQTYTATPRPAWFCTVSVLEEVKLWMRTTFDRSGNHAHLKKNLDTKTNFVLAHNARDNIYAMYRAHPMEVDAHGIETYIKPSVERRIGVLSAAGNMLVGRAHPVFNHLPA